jgi:uroporphyrinogen decarboxylase
VTPRERLLAALDREAADRLPATTHHVMRYFLRRHLGDATVDEFFDRFGLDAIRWTNPMLYGGKSGSIVEFAEGDDTILCASGEGWVVEREALPHPDYSTFRYSFTTPKGRLAMVIQGNGYTRWVTEHLLKEKRDIELIAEFAPVVRCDIEAVGRAAAEFGQRGIIRGFVPCFDVHGQPGCWQDFCCLRGTERAIMDSFDDPLWVHSALAILLERKLAFARSLPGARFDVLELGGGDASTTVISPQIFREFVAPYDSRIIEAIHEAGIRVVYHTCGGMMPILEDIADMGPDAMETFTPAAMGGDADLAEAKRRVGARVCMIGGFDQGHGFYGCRPEETRALVRKCFDEAGAGGGYILSPSDHFFDANPGLIAAFADEAKLCLY